MDIADLAGRVAAGERRALARAITLVESGRADHRDAAAALLEALAAEIDAEVDDAFEYAEASPLPVGEDTVRLCSSFAQ